MRTSVLIVDPSLRRCSKRRTPVTPIACQRGACISTSARAHTAAAQTTGMDEGASAPKSASTRARYAGSSGATVTVDTRPVLP